MFGWLVGWSVGLACLGFNFFFNFLLGGAAARVKGG